MLTTERSSPIHGVSRREFVKYCGFLAAIIGLGEAGAPQVAAAIEEVATLPIVVWSQFQECTGCTVALLQSTAPTPGQLLLQQISLAYHETAMATTGAFNEKGENYTELSLEQALEAGTFWVVEGSVATKMPEAMTITGKTSEEIAKEIYPKVKGAIAIGSCACFGNVQAADPNPTGAMGVGQFLREKGGIPDAAVINLPRCPGHGEDLVATLVYILVYGKLPELDSQYRPVFLYGQLIHDNCQRRGHFEAGHFVEQYGDQGSYDQYCLYKVGCKGPVTYAPCGVNRWNGRVSWCVASGGPCIGCAEDNFWDDLQPFYQTVPNVPFPGVAGVSVATIGWGLAGVTAAGLGVHFIGQAVSGRMFKGGPQVPPTVTELAKDSSAEQTASGMSTPSYKEAKAERADEKAGASLQEAEKDLADKGEDAAKGGDA